MTLNFKGIDNLCGNFCYDEIQDVLRYKETVTCAALCEEIPWYSQEQLTQTLILQFDESALFYTNPWLWKVNSIELSEWPELIPFRHPPGVERAVHSCQDQSPQVRHHDRHGGPRRPSQGRHGQGCPGRVTITTKNFGPSASFLCILCFLFCKISSDPSLGKHFSLAFTLRFLGYDYVLPGYETAVVKRTGVRNQNKRKRRARDHSK